MAILPGALAGLNAGRMPDLVYHLLGSLRVSTGRKLLIGHVQGGYCDKSCGNEFHGPPKTIPAGKMTKSPGRN